MAHKDGRNIQEKMIVEIDGLLVRKRQIVYVREGGMGPGQEAVVAAMTTSP